MVGVKSWPEGISHLSQWTGNEDRALSRIIFVISVGAGHMGRESTRNLRSVLNFPFKAQALTHTGESLKDLQESLDTFHQEKDVWIELGGRTGKKKKTKMTHFNIPKLVSWHHFHLSIPEMACPSIAPTHLRTCTDLRRKNHTG